MLKPLFVFGVLGVLLIPAECSEITVCFEDDGDLRVDCLIKPKTNVYEPYTFSWSAEKKEATINTNVSGSSADAQFRDKSEVTELDPHGYRMTLKGFKDNIPNNTTYICRLSGEPVSVTMSEGPLPCSAVSVFLKSSCSWIVCLLLFFYQTHS